MARKPVRKKETSSLGPQIVTVLLVVGLFAFLVTEFFKVEEQLAKLHKDVFQSTDVVTKYSFSPSEFALVITSKIKTKPLPGVFATGLVYKVVHYVGPTYHRGTMELKLSENVVLAETMASDVKTEFNVIDETTIEISNSEIIYKTLDKEIKLAKTRGKITFAGNADLTLDEFEYNDPKYKVKLTQVTMTASKTEEKLSVKAMGLTLNEIDIKNPTLAIQKADSGNTSFTGLFKELPIEVSFKTEVQDVAGQKIPIRYGNFSFPVVLFDAAFDPVIDAQMKKVDEAILGRGDSKKTLLYNLTKDSTRKALKIGILQGFTHPKNINQVGNFYKINVPKNDKIIQLESELKDMAKAQKVADGWMKLPGNSRFEVAYANIMLGGNPVGLDAAEILLNKLEKTEANNPLYMAFKGRYLLGRGNSGHDDNYDPKLVDAVKNIATTVNELNPGHKITNLLNMKLASITGDDATYEAFFEKFMNQEKDEQIKLVFKSSRLEHKDNAEALRLLEQAYSLDPNHFVVASYLGKKAHLASHLGDKASEEATYKVLVDRPDPHIYDLINYSSMLLDQKRFSEAKPYIEKCYLISGPQNYCHTYKEQLLIEAAYEKQKANKLDDAIFDVEKILFTRPQSMAAYFALGWLYTTRDPEKSFKNYSISCALNAGNGCHFAGDHLWFAKKDLEGSIVFFDLACDKGVDLGCMKAGFRTEQKGQPDVALNYFIKACKELKNKIACYHQARLFQTMKRPKEEIASYLDITCTQLKNVCALSAQVKNGNTMQLPYHPPSN